MTQDKRDYINVEFCNRDLSFLSFFRSDFVHRHPTPIDQDSLPRKKLKNWDVSEFTITKLHSTQKSSYNDIVHLSYLTKLD